MVRARNACLGQIKCYSPLVGILALHKVSSNKSLLGKELPPLPLESSLSSQGDTMQDAFGSRNIVHGAKEPGDMLFWCASARSQCCYRGAGDAPRRIVLRGPFSHQDVALLLLPAGAYIYWWWWWW